MQSRPQHADESVRSGQVEAAQDIAWELEPAKKIELGDLSKQAFEANPARIGSEVSERRASAFIGQKCIQPLARSSIEAIGDILQRRIVVRGTSRPHDAVETICAGTDDPTASEPSADLVLQCRRTELARECFAASQPRNRASA
jgi:hypothetical protein